MCAALSKDYISRNDDLGGGFLGAQTLARTLSGLVGAALSAVGGCAVQEEGQDGRR